MFRNMLMLVCLGLATQILIGCDGCQMKADLVPAGSQNVVAFCNRVQDGPDKGKLLVVVKNQGGTDAPASATKVEFFPGGTFSLPTPVVAAGQSVTLSPLAIPNGCFNSDCEFKITVDSGNQVDEFKGNDSADGGCIG